MYTNHMKILIVYTYPHHESLNGGILNTVIKNINPVHQTRVIDLYKEQFDPVLYFDKTHKRSHLQYDQETKAYRDAISWSDHIIFIFPIWWGGMPAILKGFIDRVFVQNFAYSYSTKKILPNKLLKGRSASIIVTHDTPKLMVKFIQQDYGKVLKTQVLASMCGIKVKRRLVSPDIRTSNLKQRQKFLKKIERYTQKI